MATDITEQMVDRATEAIHECMANDGWQLSGVNQVRRQRYVRTAARKALEAALMPLADIKSEDRS